MKKGFGKNGSTLLRRVLVMLLAVQFLVTMCPEAVTGYVGTVLAAEDDAEVQEGTGAQQDSEVQDELVTEEEDIPEEITVVEDENSYEIQEDVEEPLPEEAEVKEIAGNDGELEKFYNFLSDDKDENGVKLTLKDEFKTALNNPAGTYAAAGWSAGDAIPDPGDTYVTSDKTYFITDISGLFMDLDKVETLNISGWDQDLSRHIRDASKMFYGCKKLTSFGTGTFCIKVPLCEDVSRTYFDCESLTGTVTAGFGLGDKEASAELMFRGCSKISGVNLLPVTGGSNITNLSHMFYQCRKLENIEHLDKLDTSHVTDFEGVFRDCKALTAIDVSSFDTSKAEYMSYMFDSCSAITTLNLENFDTGKVKKMYDIFARCTELKTLNISGFDFSHIEPAGQSVCGTEDMFSNCTALRTIYIKDQATADYLMMPACRSKFDPDTMEFKILDMSALDQELLYKLYTYTEIGSSNKYQLGLQAGFKAALNANNAFSVGGVFKLKPGDKLPDPAPEGSTYHGKITSYKNLFWGVTAERLNLALFKGDNINDMSQMFEGCAYLKVLDISGLKPENGADLSEMLSNTGRGWYEVVSPGHRPGSLMAEARVCDAQTAELFKSNITGWSSEKIKISVLRTVSYRHCGKGDDEEARVEEGKKAAALKPAYPGYAFKGWYTSEEYKEDELFDFENTLINSDITLYAKWEYTLELSENELESFYTYSKYGKDECKLALTDAFKEALDNEAESYTITRDDGSTYSWGIGDPLPDPGISHNISGIDYPLTSMSWMFKYCKARSLDLSKWNTSNVESMRGMFERCRYMKKLDISSFNTSKVTDMGDMFVYFADDVIGGYDELDLRHFDVSGVTSFNDMFAYSDIRVINLDTWEIPAARNMEGMFGCAGMTEKLYMRNISIPDDCTFDRLFYGVHGSGEQGAFVYVKDENIGMLFESRKAEYGAEAKIRFISVADPAKLQDVYLEQLYTYSIYEVNYYKVALKAEFATEVNKKDGHFVSDDGNYVWDAGDPLPNPASPNSVKYAGKVRSYQGMFENCTAEYLDLSLFATSGVKNYSDMLKNCRKLKAVILNGFSFDDGAVISGMLSGTCADNTGGAVQGAADIDETASTLNDNTKTGIDTSKLVFKKLCLVSFNAGGGSGKMATRFFEPGDEFNLPACSFTAPEGKVFARWSHGDPGTTIDVEESMIITAEWRCDHMTKRIDAVAVSCETDGNITYYVCSRCGGLYTDEGCTEAVSAEQTVIHAPGHDWTEWETVTEASRTTEGLKRRTCKRAGCGKTEEEVIPIVIPEVPDGVALSAGELKMKIGESTVLKATVDPANAIDKTLSWKSDNEKAVTVDANGKLTAVWPGSAKVTVTTANGKTAQCTVTVEKKYANDTDDDVRMSEADFETYVKPELKTEPVKTGKLMIGETEAEFTIVVTYMSAVTYNGKAQKPEDSNGLKALVDTAAIVKAAGLEGRGAGLIKVKYKSQNSINAGKETASFYAVLSMDKKAAKAANLTSAEKKLLNKLIKAANKALKASPCKYSINKASFKDIKEGGVIELQAGLNKDGTLKMKKDKIAKLKSLKLKFKKDDAKYTKLNKKMYELSDIKAEACMVRVSGKQNYTGYVTVKAEK